MRGAHSPVTGLDRRAFLKFSKNRTRSTHGQDGSLKVASLLAAGACASRAWPERPPPQDTKIALGMSGWTGFAPLTLADKAGIFKKNGLDVELKMIPQKDRHLALASGAIQCAATTVETHVAWNANGVPIVQIFQMDKSYGADGMAVRNDVKSFADLKGKSDRRERPGHRAVLRPGLDAQQERHDAEGREAGLARAAARRAGLRGRPERRRHDLRALPRRPCAPTRPPARSWPPRSTTRW